MLTAAEFGMLLAVHAVPATLVRAKGGQLANLRAIVAPLNKDDEQVVNAYGINGVSIQALASAFGGTPPEKFDTVTAGGDRWTLETVIPQYERGSGALIYFLCYAKGR